MKSQIYSVFFVLFITHFLSAQSVIQQDSYNLSGGILLSFSDNNHPDFSSKTTSFIFDPALTYHLLDILAIGGTVHIRYSDEKIKTESGSERSIERIFELGPRVRYYFHNKNFAPFIDCTLHYSKVLPEKTEGYGFAIGTGINYFISKSVAIEPRFSLTLNYYSNPKYDLQTYQVGVGLNYHINE